MKKAVRSCNALALWTDPRWESLIFEGMSPSPGKRQDSAKTTGMSWPRAGRGLGAAGRDSQGETGPGSAARDSLLPTGPRSACSACSLQPDTRRKCQSRNQANSPWERSLKGSVSEQGTAVSYGPVPTLGLLFSEGGQIDSFRMCLQSAVHLMS